MRTPVLFVLLLLIVESALVLRANGGRFVYTLDDPYIHLALSEEIPHGTYGVNRGEASAPSSSPAWPFLLVPFGAAGWAPFALNVLLSVAIALVLGRIARAALPDIPGARLGWFRGALAVALVLSTNVVGLAFTGMEHSAHVLLTLLVVLGLWNEANGAPLPRWLPLAIVAGPLLRYEALAFSLPAIVLLALRGRRRVALASAAGVVLALAAFSFFLHSQGLGWVPTSVLVKSQPVSSASATSFLYNAHVNLATRQGAMLAILALAIAMAAFDSRRARSIRAFAAWALAGVALHILLGRFGWYHRYEIYAFAAALAAVLLLYGVTLVLHATRAPRTALGTCAAACAALAILAYPYWNGLRTIPDASANVYEQHFQMHRFAADVWRAPVAVNDLGYVSYRNDQYVLDLWGLGSRRALAHRRMRDGSQWMNDLAREHDVHLAMIYGPWFKTLPENWTPIADLRFRRKIVSAARSLVTFYALDEDARTRALPLLEEFGATLPKGASLELRGDGDTHAVEDAFDGRGDTTPAPRIPGVSR